jgi:hypothetical protein
LQGRNVPRKRPGRANDLASWVKVVRSEANRR